MITWASPMAFLLFIPLLAALVWYFWQMQKNKPTVQMSSLQLFANSGVTWKTRLSKLPMLLKVLALVLMIFALARPQRADTKVKRDVEGIDIMIALDISDSILIEDMKPENRMESSKHTIKQFIENRVSDRIGLVVFSGESYTRVPLTLDYPLLLENLSKVETSRNIKMGTAIGVALANAAGRLKESTAKSRVIIFLTDGENNSGTIDPETALEIAKGYGLKIYTIGMGQDGQAQLPVTLEDEMGNKVKRYRPIHSAVNNDLLAKMAEETDGKYYRATTTNALENVFKDIDKLEKTKIEMNQFTKYAELFPTFVEWALLFYIASLILKLSILRRIP